MRAGDLRNRVTIERPTSGTRTGLGTPTTWSTLATVWAAINPLEGRELLAAQQVQSEITVEIVIRYRADVTAAMRIKHGGTTYEIKSPPIDSESRHQWLRLMCAQQSVGA